MNETTTKKSAKTGAAAVGGETPKFPMPKFDMPKLDMPKFGIPGFEIPKFEIPAAFRDLAEQSASQAKGNYDKMKTMAEEATEVLEDTFATASKGATDCGVKLIEIARANTNAAFDFAAALLGAKSIAGVVELSTAQMRRNVEALQRQGSELTALAQKVSAESSEPVKQSLTKAFSKVA